MTDSVNGANGPPPTYGASIQASSAQVYLAKAQDETAYQSALRDLNAANAVFVKYGVKPLEPHPRTFVPPDYAATRSKLATDAGMAKVRYDTNQWILNHPGWKVTDPVGAATMMAPILKKYDLEERWTGSAFQLFSKKTGARMPLAYRGTDLVVADYGGDAAVVELARQIVADVEPRNRRALRGGDMYMPGYEGIDNYLDPPPNSFTASFTTVNSSGDPVVNGVPFNPASHIPLPDPNDPVAVAAYQAARAIEDQILAAGGTPEDARAHAAEASGQVAQQEATKQKVMLFGGSGLGVLALLLLAKKWLL